MQKYRIKSKMLKLKSQKNAKKTTQIYLIFL